MTKKQVENVKNLKIGSAIDIGQVTVKRDRGQFNISRGDYIGTYRDSEIALLIEKVDELNTEVVTTTNQPFVIEGTNWIGHKTPLGMDLYENGKLIHRGLSERDFYIQIEHKKKEVKNKETEKVRKNINKEYKSGRQKKTLYYFILFLSAVILAAIYILGIKFDGVTIRRDNELLYETITKIANEKYPEKKSDKFDAVYYTLNYFAHNDSYLMLEKELEDGDSVIIYSYLRKITPEQLYNMTNNTSYSGSEFNDMFKDEHGRFVNKELTYRYIGYIMGVKTSTIEELVLAYKKWDENDNRVNKAYEWKALSSEGTSMIDERTNYYNTYLRRNGFIKLFLNDSSKFIHEYILFESLGWLNWTSFAVLILYILLAISVWLFKKNNLKTSKPLITIIMVLSLIIIVPLVLQYFFESLNKAPNQFLDIIENTQFTTTTTFMNFIFSYIMKFSNIVLTGILTIALPMKIIRYFVLNAIDKLDKDSKITKMIAPDTIITEKISKSDWRL